MNRRKNLSLITFLLITCFTLMANSGNVIPQHRYNIKQFGANGNGKFMNTNAFNDAINRCAANGGGTVIVPEGTYLTGTIVMKSKVNLHLEEGAVIKGSTDLDSYEAYTPTKDMTKYGMAYFPGWTRGLIVATGQSNFSITGKGVINGSHVTDPKGEEGIRGPHMIVFGECKNFEISGITTDKASNYAFVGYECENATFHNLIMTEGWDGIHIRGAKNVIIRNCEFYTGDDAIAGGFWENVVISQCYINSACNGIRVIFPATDLTIEQCEFKGPGLYPQRSTFDGQRRNMLGAIIVQPGGWDFSPGPLDNIRISDIKIDDMTGGITVVLNEGNHAGSILIENVYATNLLGGHSVESWKGGVFEKVVLRNIYTEFTGSDDIRLRDKRLTRESIDPRRMPYWAFYSKNIKELTLENIDFKYNGTEIRPAMGFENTGVINLINVNTMEVPETESIVTINSGIVNR